MPEYLERYISAADGLKLYVRDYRPVQGVRKRPILCLCGLTRNSRDFDGVAKRLQEYGHRVVTLDYRGRGLSAFDENWENYTPHTYLSDIFNVASALGLHECCVIGTSLGGLLAMGMCVAFPTLVHSVVLNDVGPDLDHGALDKIIAYCADGAPVASLKEAIEKLQKHYGEEKGFVEKDWENIARKTYRLENGHYIPSWDVKIADRLRLNRAKTDQPDIWPYFHALGQRPVLLIRGEHSAVFKRETFEKMLSLLPNIKGVEVAGCGHAPTLEEDEAQKAVDAFLQ